MFNSKTFNNKNVLMIKLKIEKKTKRERNATTNADEDAVKKEHLHTADGQVDWSTL